MEEFNIFTLKAFKLMVSLVNIQRVRRILLQFLYIGNVKWKNCVVVFIVYDYFQALNFKNREFRFETVKGVCGVRSVRWSNCQNSSIDKCTMKTVFSH